MTLSINLKTGAEAGYVPLAEKGAPFGVPTLDSKGHLTESELPPTVVIGNTHNEGSTYVANAGGRDFYNPTDYRRVIDVDDTRSLQLAGEAAIENNGVLLITKKLRISETITWGTSGGSTFELNVMAMGSFAYVKWIGANNSTMFQTWGLNKSRWDGLWIALEATAENITCFSHDCGATQNTSNNTITNSFVPFSLQKGIVGWRVGYLAASSQDISGWLWSNCKVTGGESIASSTSGNIGWAMGGWNSCTHVWVDCGGSNLQKMWTSVALSGGAQNALANGWTILGPDCHGNYIDIDIGADSSGSGHFNGTVQITGGKMENQVHRVLNVNSPNSTSNQPISVAFEGVDFYNCKTDDGYLFTLNAAGMLACRHCEMGGLSSALTKIAELSCNTASTGLAEFAYNQFDVSEGTFWTIGTGTWRVTALENVKNRKGKVEGNLTNTIPWQVSFAGSAPTTILATNLAVAIPTGAGHATIHAVGGGGGGAGGGSAAKTGGVATQVGGSGGGSGASVDALVSIAEGVIALEVTVGAGGVGGGGGTASEGSSGNVGAGGGTGGNTTIKATGINIIAYGGSTGGGGGANSTTSPNVGLYGGSSNGGHTASNNASGSAGNGGSATSTAGSGGGANIGFSGRGGGGGCPASAIKGGSGGSREQAATLTETKNGATPSNAPANSGQGGDGGGGGAPEGSGGAGGSGGSGYVVIEWLP